MDGEDGGELLGRGPGLELVARSRPHVLTAPHQHFRHTREPTMRRQPEIELDALARREDPPPGGKHPSHPVDDRSPKQDRAHIGRNQAVVPADKGSAKTALHSRGLDPDVVTEGRIGRPGLEKAELGLELRRKPQIVRVQKPYEGRLPRFISRVSSRLRATSLAMDAHSDSTIALRGSTENIGAPVVTGVVDDPHPPRSHSLIPHRVDRLLRELGAVAGWNDHVYQR